MGTLVIRKPRRKSAVYALCFLACAALGGIIGLKPQLIGLNASWVTQVVGWSSLLVGIYGAIAWTLAFARPTVLTLTDDGFTVDHGWKTSRVRWAEIAEIHVWGSQREGMAAWTVRPDDRGRSWMRFCNRMFGCDETVGAGWELSGNQIASEMKRRHHAAQQKS